MQIASISIPTNFKYAKALILVRASNILANKTEMQQAGLVLN